MILKHLMKKDKNLTKTVYHIHHIWRFFGRGGNKFPLGTTLFGDFSKFGIFEKSPKITTF